MRTVINTMMEIQDDELITSWVEMLAANNDFSVQDFQDCFKNSNHRYTLFFRKDYFRNLDYFCKEYGIRGFPDVVDVIKKHTGYYACYPFREKGLNILISESMLREYNRESSEKRIFCDKYIKDETAKYMICPECMKEDIEKYCRPYVHVWHNLPTVTCCQKHGCKLIELDSENREVIRAEEGEMQIARFMYQMYLNPYYGHLNQVVSIIENHNQDTTISVQSEVTDIVATLAKLVSYDEFVKFLKENGIDDKTNIIVERRCEMCGNSYHINLEAEVAGFNCPECDKNKDVFQIFERFVECCGNHEFELLKLLPEKRLLVMHKPCGTKTKRFILDIIRDELSCYKCEINRVGEKSIATNGQVMTIIRYGRSTDIDVRFEDGTVVTHKNYACFLSGSIQNPNYKVTRRIDRTGEKNTATNGQVMTIIRYGDSNDIDVCFEDETIVCNKSYLNFLKGNIMNPNCKSGFKDRTGEVSTATNGQQMTIIRYGGSNDIDVRFEDGTVVENKAYSCFIKGGIENPNYKLDKKTDRTGEKTIAKNGQVMTIIRYRANNDLDVEFEDGTVINNKSYASFLKGEIKNPNCRFNKEKERLGEIALSKNGQQMTIIHYTGANNMDVQFEDGTIVKNKSYENFLKGNIRNPNCKLSRKKDRTGETVIASNGQEMTIIRYESVDDIDVRFEDGTIVKNRSYKAFVKGLIKNPNCSNGLKDRTGEKSTATNGQVMTIIRYGGSNDIDVQFEDGTIVKNKSYDAFLKGKIQNPNRKVSKKQKSNNL